ncbi:MAG: TonB-dependent receptor [Lentisphaerae bacterium]|nr:TonB-dependent receptor [Lentisphaerota bacterium]
MKSTCACTILALTATLAPSTPGQITESNVLATLPEVSVTASRTARESFSEPATVYRREGQSLTTADALRTTPDALRGLPSVMVQKTAYGQGSPFLRGFTGYRTLALIDGIRLNNSTFRDGPNQYWNTIDPLSVSTYDVMMGPGSVMYGSDAIGGTLNALTMAPPAYDGAPTWERRAYYRGATAERSTVGRLQIAGAPTADLGVAGGISAKSFGDLHGGDAVGRQSHTGYDELDYDARLDYAPAPGTRLSLVHQSVDQDDAWRTHRTIYGVDWKGLAHGDDKVHSFDQHRDLTYLRLNAEDLDGLADGLSATVSRQAQNEDLHRVRKDDTRDEQSVDTDTYGTTLQLEKESALGEWVYGADYYRDFVNSGASRFRADGSLSKVEIQGPVADDATYDLAGLFLADTIRLGDGALDLIPGARYTYARADADRVKDPVSGKATSVTEDWQALTASLRALVPLTTDRHHVLFSSVAQGFRAPNLSDLTRLDTARSNEIETPSPGLDPEHYVTFETGLKSRGQHLDSRLSYYYTWIDDMIVRTPTGQTIDELAEVTKQNSGAGYVQGVEWMEMAKLSASWSTWLSATWMDGEVDAYPTSADQRERDTISRLMPPTAQVGVRWQTPNGRYWAETAADMAEKADKLSADDKRDTQRIPPGGTPGYAVALVRVGTTVLDPLTLALAVENIFDEDYRIHGSGVNEPGRNLILTADCTF